MCRIEIIANKSVQDDVIDVLEDNVTDILYTIIPVVYGRGKRDRKLGTGTWPETNFLLFSYVKKSQIPIIRGAIQALKQKFPNEGIKLFITKKAML